MREMHKTRINGHAYEVTALPATRGWKLLLRVVKIVGPSLGIVIDGVGLSADEGEPENLLERLSKKKVKDKFFEQAIASLAQRLDEDGVEYIIEELSSVTRLRLNADKMGPKLNEVFEAHFQGKPVDMIKWLGFALKAQLGDFSSVLELAALQDEAGQQAAEA